MPRPARRRRARGGEHRREPFAVDAALAAAGRPRDHASGNPRHLQLDRGRRARSRSRLGRRSSRGRRARRVAARWFGAVARRLGIGALIRVPGPGRRDAALLRLEVGDHLLALVAAQRPGAREMLLGVARAGRPARRATTPGRPRAPRAARAWPRRRPRPARTARTPSRRASASTGHRRRVTPARDDRPGRRRRHLCIRAYISAGQLGGHVRPRRSVGAMPLLGIDPRSRSVTEHPTVPRNSAGRPVPTSICDRPARARRNGGHPRLPGDAQPPGDTGQSSTGSANPFRDWALGPPRIRPGAPLSSSLVARSTSSVEGVAIFTARAARFTTAPE